MMFSVLLTIIYSLVAYLELSITFVHMNIVCQRIRNDFRQSLVSKNTRKATRRSQPSKQRRFWTRPGRTSQIIRSSYKVASDWLGRTMKNNVQYGGYGGRRDVGEKRHNAQALNFEK